MSGSDNISRPSADVAREKTEASIRQVRQYGKPKGSNGLKGTNGQNGVVADCNAVKNMPIVENAVGNTSPNATNLSR